MRYLPRHVRYPQSSVPCGRVSDLQQLPSLGHGNTADAGRLRGLPQRHDCNPGVDTACGNGLRHYGGLPRIRESFADPHGFADADWLADADRLADADCHTYAHPHAYRDGRRDLGHA
jgi:hypothetical protein